MSASANRGAAGGRRALIVEDGQGLQILAAVRSLGRAGWTVGLGNPEPGSRSEASRFVHARHRVPRPEDGVDAFVAAVNEAADEGGYDVVFPGDDIEMLALSARRADIRTCVPYAPHDVVLRTVDKLALTEAAQRAGIGAPATVAATDDAIADVALPAVVKARLHWSPDSAASERHLLVRVCHDRDEVRARVREIETAGGSAMLQELAQGDLMAVSTVVDRGGALVAVSQQRTTMASLRRTSVRAVTTPVDADLVAGVAALLQDLGWFGLANLQFISVPGRGPLLIDFNGRYYGSMALAVAAGADLPAIWAELAVGGSSRTVSRAAAGRRYHNFEEDLDRARVERRGGLGRDILDVARTFPGSVHAMWSAADPGPTVAFFRTLAGRRVHRLARRLRRQPGSAG